MKVKTTGFWISLASAIVLVVQALANAFGFKCDAKYVNEIVTSVCGVLVVVGVLIPTNNKKDDLMVVDDDFENFDEDLEQENDLTDSNL